MIGTRFNSSRLDMVLVFPPQWYYLHIPPELVGLAAFLRGGGYAVEAIDANIEAADWLLSEAFPGAAAPDGTAGSDATAVERAKQALRSEVGFYDLEKHVAAVGTLDRAWNRVSAAYSPTEIDFSRFRSPYDPQCLRQCMQAAQDATVNPYFRYVREVLLPRLLDRDPRAIGLIYVHPEQMIPIFTIAAALREAGSAAHLVVLGSLEDQVTFTRYLRQSEHRDWEQFFRLFDSVVKFEAEPALPGLLDALRNLEEPSGIPNLAVWRNGRVIVAPAPVIVDPNVLPCPDYAGIDFSRYLYPERVFALLASRGCYWGRCAFCAIASNQPSFRTRRAARTVDDMELLQDAHGTRWFHFRDMLFSPSYMHALSAEILARSLNVRWTCRARLESAFTPQILAQAAKAGCVQIWFGMESANDDLLRAMDKGTRIAETRTVLRSSVEAGIGAHLLVLHGFPGETDRQAEETVEFIEESAGWIDSVSYSHFVLFSESPIYTSPARFGARLVGRENGLFQYRFEHLSPAQRAYMDLRYQRLRARVCDAVPMRLIHPAAVPLYRERLGPGSWQSRA